ncbi:aspartic peptidase A1 [Lyophyllum atratum]|nr:aspartic peptidase A1 [Lyophyllum atratum]
MKFHAIPLALGLAAVTTSAYRTSFKQVKHQSTFNRRAVGNSASDTQLSVLATTDDNALDLNTVQDLIYIADISVGGTVYPVQLDTGSSDLWIKGPVFPIPGSQPTSEYLNLTYAIGWASGNVSSAPVEFANLSISSQAFLDVSTAQNGALGYGANGIVGLGFTSLSTIDAYANHSSSSAGRSLLYNMFAANPTEPNFLSFALQRSTEAGDEVEGSFSIGEYEPQYAEVANRTAIPTWPVNSPNRWNVLLDAVIVNNSNNTIVLPTTSVVGAPSNKAVVLLDSGSSFTYAPKAICDAIYGSIPGAKYEARIGQWIVPCDYEVNVALQIGGQVYPIHPLDVTPSGLTNNNVCVGSFVPQLVTVADGDFDWLVGDNFLRSVYSIYDFGDFDESGKMGNPYMKLLPIVDPDEASLDFHQARGGQAKTNITYQGLDGAAAMPSFNISQDISSSLERIGRYLPAMLGVVALNALILIVLAIAGTVIYCRRRQPSARVRARAAPGRMSPMPMNPRHSYVAGSGLPPPQPHIYEPVSMALTEDTFVPPSPAFHHLKEGTLRPGDRPKSMA